MNETDRKRVRRRRSLRLSRQSSALLVPLVSDSEATDCPGDYGVENVGASCTNSNVYNVGLDLDGNGGSFWEEVDENKLRKKRKSRRSNIGFYLARSEYEEDDKTTDSEAHCETEATDLDQQRLEPAEPAADTPDIEIPRHPCPEASPYVQTPTSYITALNTLDISQTITPSLVNDKSLPYIHTPSSAIVSQSSLLESGKGFDDAFMLGMDTPGSSQNPSVSCPPSCEDDSEDSLLICTPDLSKFKKNIRFRCSLAFTEFDQTPTKGENPADNSQDSIHESPIVGYVYDKLNASDVVRKRRSTSHRSGNSSSIERRTPKNHGAPKRLIPSSSKAETKIVEEHSSFKKTEESELKPSKSLNVSVQSSSSSHSNPSSSSSASGSYTSCVDEDFLSVPSSQPSPFDSPVPAESPAWQVPQSGQSTPVFSQLPMEEVQQNGAPAHTDKHKESEMNTLDVGDTAEAMNSDETDATVHVECADNQSKLPCDDTSVPCDANGEKGPREAAAESVSNVKERNIASDVCEMFRSLARKFSGGKKKKRKSGCLKKTKDRASLLESDDISGGNGESSFGAVNGGYEIFSFRKDPKLPKQLSEESSKTSGDSTPKAGEAPTSPKSLDFSPFLSVAEGESNVTNVDARPVSPVWKLQSDQEDYVDSDSKKLGDSLSAVGDENGPLIIETVLQEKSTNIESDESCEKATAKKRARPKRRSIEASVLAQECREFQATEPVPVEEEEENSSLRRSRRTRRSSLEMFRYQSQTPEGFSDSPESLDSPDSDTETQKKKPRSRKKTAPEVPEENLEELYRNKNYTLPTERMWETVFESPEKSKQPNILQSRRKYRRTITFDTLPPAKIRKRLQRAVTQGWDVTGKKRTHIPLEEVKNKIALLAVEIDGMC